VPSSGPRAGSLHRGDLGMWSWVAHRITGVLTLFFLFAHVLDTALVRVSPNAYDKVIRTRWST
jgi:succinate dehydrogenase / fumarate reductase cytochrome b subunit